MSSFIGHSLAALGIFSVEKQPLSTQIKKYWLGWLILVASAPDIDHGVHFLHLTYQGHDLRITHSINHLCNLASKLIVLLEFDHASVSFRFSPPVAHPPTPCDRGDFAEILLTKRLLFDCG